jgi:hypothetical protein
VTLGEQSTKLPFTVRDLRGSRSALGGTPGLGGAGEEEQAEEELTEEEIEERLEAEQERERGRRGR